jgi:V-type H+-transporting ATPase subunit a
VLDVKEGGEGEGKRDPMAIDSSLHFVVGVIERKKLSSFERVLWRALRGNIYMNSCEMPNYEAHQVLFLTVMFRMSTP